MTKFLVPCFLLLILDHFAGLGEARGSSTSREIRSRGYQAEDIFLKVQEGRFTINLVRASNPLVPAKKNKIPVLLIHGTLASADTFILFRDDVKPKDYSGYNASELSVEQLAQLVGDDRAFLTVTYGLLNFGHEVWAMNRRPTHQARQSSGYSLSGRTYRKVANWAEAATHRLGRSEENQEKDEFDPYSFEFKENPANWNYSLDEQVKFDIPEAIRYITETTGYQRISVVSHSIGGTLLLAALTLEPELANKIDKALLWAPSFYISSDRSDLLSQLTGESSFEYTDSRVGSFPPEPLIDPINEGKGKACQKDDSETKGCSLLTARTVGYGGDQQMSEDPKAPRRMDPSSTSELAQISQNKGKVLHMRDFNSPEANMVAYGSAKPPAYDASKISFDRIYFYAGHDDKNAPPYVFDELFADLTVSYSFELLGNETLHWNHNSFFYHKNIAKLLILPAIKTLESA